MPASAVLFMHTISGSFTAAWLSADESRPIIFQQVYSMVTLPSTTVLLLLVCFIFFRIVHLAAVQCAWMFNKQSLHRCFERDAERVEPYRHLPNGQLFHANVCASATGVTFHSKL